jgi:hypothetical protein
MELSAVAEARNAALPAKRAALAAQVLALPLPTSPGVDDLSDGRAGRPVYCTRTLLKETTALLRARALNFAASSSGRAAGRLVAHEPRHASVRALQSRLKRSATLPARGADLWRGSRLS